MHEECGIGKHDNENVRYAPRLEIFMRQVLCVAVAVLLFAAAANAQEVCKMEQLKDSKVSLADVYARAEGKAKAWKSDAVLARLTSTSMGPLDEQ